MLPRGPAVLAAAALGARAVAVTVRAGSDLRDDGNEPFDSYEPFADFYEPFGALTVDSVSRLRPKWRPPPRSGVFPFEGPQPGARWENRMLIVPDRKFAFCYIEKNACTQFNRLMNALNGMSSDDAIPFWKSNSDGRFKGYFEDGLGSISKANGWKLGIFVRDPAERFLSAWLSKCDAWEYGGIDCLGPRITDLPESKKVELFEKMVVELLPEYMARMRANGTYNAHYDPQHLFCGGRHLDEYDFVGRLSGSPKFISNQVEDMLQHQAGIGKSSEPMKFAQKLFPADTKAGHKTDTTNVLRTFYRNVTVYKTVLDLYAQDYRWAPLLQAGKPQTQADLGEVGRQ